MNEWLVGVKSPGLTLVAWVSCIPGILIQVSSQSCNQPYQMINQQQSNIRDFYLISNPPSFSYMDFSFLILLWFDFVC